MRVQLGMISVYFLLCLASARAWSCPNGKIFVSQNGSDILCLSTKTMNSTERFECKSIEFLARMNVTNCSIIITSGYLYIQSAAIFNNVSNISIVGRADGPTEVLCNTSSKLKTGDEGVGILFVNSSQIILANLSIEFCALVYMGTLQGVHMHNTTDVTITNVHFFKNNGYGLSLINVNGSVTVESCTFKHNRLTNSAYSHGYYGGGGLQILMQSRPNAYPTTGGAYNITNCQFLQNSARVLYSKELRNDAAVHNRGGGVRIVLLYGSNNNYFLINSCVFSNNSALGFAGGLEISFNSQNINNVFFISQSNFSDNVANLEGGGAVDITTSVYLKYPSELPENNKVIFSLCEFSSNKAVFGGAVAISVLQASASNKSSNFILFNYCTFKGNRATSGGSAILISKSKVKVSGFSSSAVSLVKYVNFSNCQFQGNAYGGIKVKQQPGYGSGVLLTDLDIAFRDSTL